MDPVSAVGIAAAVVQFISFTSQIIAIAASPDSAAGASAEISSLEEVCSKLHALGEDLETKSHFAQHAIEYEKSQTVNLGRRPQLESPLQTSYASLHTLLTKCDAMCKEITEVLEDVKSKHNPASRWSNFIMTVRMRLNEDKINKIEQQLKRYQSMVSLEIANISLIYHDTHLRELASARRESERLGVQQSLQLETIKSILGELRHRSENGRLGQRTAESPSKEISIIQQMMSKVTLSEEKMAKEIEILRSLGFDSRTVRREAIPDAHRETFEWVFNHNTFPSDGGRDRSQLINWLYRGKGVFWVSGKPGSGKSTFMKFLSTHQRTRAALTEWSHPLPAVLASHYFWSLGTKMQKSRQGLLQSLIYDIFRHCPDLIKVACESRWDAREQWLWTPTELRATLETLSKQTQVPCKFCFFIDGLDEYEGDHLDFCESLTALLDSPNIKLCVSSRPWNVFEDAFGHDKEQKLYIHELTLPDILQYAKDRLHQHPRWRLLGYHTTRADSLIESIANKAHGVFLWVFLVTKLLREGLTNDDTFTDLQNMLESFPVDLEPFFRQIMESVPTFYRGRMGEALRMALAAHEPLNAMVYSCHDDAEATLNTESTDDLEWTELAQARRKRIVRRLNGWCKGLLELNRLGQVDFLHRTVADFLRTRDMSNYLLSYTRVDFNPDLAIMKAYLVWLTLANRFGPGAGREDSFSLRVDSDRLFSTASYLDSPLAYHLQTVLKHASTLDFEGTVEKMTLDDLIRSIDSAVTSFISSSSLTLQNEPAEPYHSYNMFVWQPSRLFRQLVLEMPDFGYILREISRNRSYFMDFDLPAIHVVLNYPENQTGSWPNMVSEKLTLLLELGHDANQQVPGVGGTVWIQFLKRVLKEFRSMQYVACKPRFLEALCFGLFQIFLEKGQVDPNAIIGSEKFKVLDEFIGQALAIPLDTPNNFEAKYLETLDAFISRGAMLSDFLRCPWVNPILSLLEALQTALKSATPAHARYWRDVLARVVPLMRAAGWPLSQYPGILEFFQGSVPSAPETESTDLLRARSAQQVAAGSKRRLSDEEYGTGERSKRPAWGSKTEEDLVIATASSVAKQTSQNEANQIGSGLCIIEDDGKPRWIGLK